MICRGDTCRQGRAPCRSNCDVAGDYDPLRPMRGVLAGVAVSLVLWFAALVLLGVV